MKRFSISPVYAPPHSRWAVTDSRDDLASLEERRRELRVHGVKWEVDRGAKPAGVEDGVVVPLVDVREHLGVRELLFHSLVVEELGALFVILEVLCTTQISIDGKGKREKGGQPTSTLLGSSGGLGPVGAAKSISACGERTVRTL